MEEGQWRQSSRSRPAADSETPSEGRPLRTRSSQRARPDRSDHHRNLDSLQDGNRNEHFDEEWEPFRYDDDLQLQDDKVTGPIWFMNPSRAIFRFTAGSASLNPENEALEQLESKRSNGVGESFTANVRDVEHEWTSRNNRKGRHAIIIRESDEKTNPYATPRSTSGPRPILRGLWRMVTVFTIHDVSYLLAVAFTLACTILAVNAVLSFLPYINSKFQASSTLYRIEAVLAVLGCTLFFVGSLFAFSEAVNVNRKGCFGWKLQHLSHVEPDSMDTGVENVDATLLVPDGSCYHHHDSYRTVAGHPESWTEEVNNRQASTFRPEERAARTQQPWIWMPSPNEVWSHLRYDIGFICATALAASSSMYCAMAWAALATTFISDEVASWIRFPQLIAAVGFTASCALSMVETQRDWWRPSLDVIGWHANVFNVIGSVGFLLTAAFGYAQREMRWAEYQYGCAYLWGSLAFLLGSMLQWYEALDKYPVNRVKAED